MIVKCQDEIKAYLKMKEVKGISKESIKEDEKMFFKVREV